MAFTQNLRCIMFILFFLHTGYLLQAQKTDRYLELSGGDSVWVIKNSLLSRSKFFIGKQQVNFAKWQSHLQEEDAEISKLIKKGTGLRKASTWIVLGGLVATTAGILVHTNSGASGIVNEKKQKAGTITIGLGIVATTLASVLGKRGWASYFRGMRLYNNKVLQPPKQPLSLQLQIEPTTAAIRGNYKMAKEK